MLGSFIQQKILLVYLLLMNVICFGLFAWDKQRARRHAWRIQEKTLFLWAVLGGSLGGLLGMYAFRHKTRHLKFKLGFPLIFVVQAVLLYFLYQ